MKKIMSVKKHKSSIAKAVHKQKKITKQEVNKKDQEKTPTSGFGQMIHDWILAVEKKLRNK
jgi:hypothetical protein